MATEVVHFGDITVDLRRMSLTRGGQPVSVEPKTFDVLRYLIEHRDRLVTKEELLDAAWKDTFVTPNVLTRAIAQLRKALGDDAFEPRYIETVAKRGYRFIAPVEIAQTPAGASAMLVSEAPLEPIARSKVISRARRRTRTAVALVAPVFAALAFGIYIARERPGIAPQPEANVQVSPRRFTTGSHSYSFPSISPDGRTVAYSSDRSGSNEIYTMSLAPGSRELAITNDNGQNIQPTWSPDGQWLAYHSRGKSGIWVVPSGGGAVRRVADFGSWPAWVDSRHVVFTSDAGGMAAQSVLWSVDRDGGDLRQLTKLGAPRGGHAKPTVSPDGRLIAFTVSQGSIGVEIWTMPAAGGQGMRIAAPAGFGTPQFSRDGSALYWVARNPEGNDSVVRASIDARGAPVGPIETLMTLPGMFVGGLSIARDGTSVISLYSGTANLWAVDVPATSASAAPVQLTFEDVRNTLPRHFRDGRVAFQQFASGRPLSTWVMDEDGNRREVLSAGLPVGVGAPQWAPDGKRMFVLSEPSRQAAFAWLDVASRQLTPIPLRAEGMMNTVLSPDGREVAFHVIDEGGVLNIWTQQLDGGPRKQLTFDKEAISYPAWSRDGKWLAVEIKRGQDTRIGVMSRDGGPVEEIVAEPGQNWPHSWAPDNDGIAFAGARDGVWNIYTVSRRTREIRQLTNFTSINGYVRYPSWSVNRPRIIFERAEHRGSLWTARLP